MFLSLYAIVGCAPPEASEPAGKPAHEAAAPLLTLTPAELSFGDVPVAVPSTLELRIANEGGGELRATLALSDDTSGFSVDTLDLELEAGLGQRVNVTFEPSAIGEVAISLVVTSNDEVEPVKFVPITGSGLGPQLEAAEDPLALGEMGLRCPASGRAVLKNVGTTPVTIDAFTFADPMFAVASRPVTLAPEESASVDVSATPLMLGESVGTLVAETALGSVYAGTVSVVGVPAPLITETWVIANTEADVLVVLDGTLPDWVDVLGQLEALFALTEAGHRLAVTLADDGCISGGWIDSAAAAPRDALYEMLSAEVGALDEQGFTRALAALAPEALGAGGCNEGLLRDDAALVVLGVTDDIEQSALGWVELVAAVQAMEVDPSRVVVGAVGGDYPTGCDDLPAALGWYEAAVATDGVYLSLCATDWASAVIDDLEERYVVLEAFELSVFPDPSTIHVYIDGVEVTEGWVYDGGDNSVDFGAALPPGTEVVIVYEGPCEG